MRGGAELPMTPVSELFLKLFDGNSVAPGVGSVADNRIVSTQMGLTGTVDEVSAMIKEAGPAGLGMEGGGRRRRLTQRRRGSKRRDSKRGNRKPRFRLNLRASIRWRQ
jgi:hypothetical protein